MKTWPHNKTLAQLLAERERINREIEILVCGDPRVGVTMEAIDRLDRRNAGVDHIYIAPQDFDAIAASLAEPGDPSEKLKALLERKAPWEDE